MDPAASHGRDPHRRARTHNLKNINLDLPRNRLIVITGLSGSGKSSLAFDTLYAEGQRRYVESLSAYARQFLQLMEKPDVDLIEGLSPAISIEQKATSHNPRSTVGTVTEIHDYLRLLYARVGTPYCPEHGVPLEAQTVSQMVDHVAALPEDTRLMILAPVVADRKGEQVDLFDELRAQGFVRVRIDGTVHEIDALPKLAKNAKHIDRRRRRPPEGPRRRAPAPGRVVRDRAAPRRGPRHRAGDATAAARAPVLREVRLPGLRLLAAGARAAAVLVQQPDGRLPDLRRPGRDRLLRPAARGRAPDACRCAGGAIKGWDRRNQFYFQMLTSLAAHYGFDVEVPFEQLPENVQARSCCTAPRTRSRSATSTSAARPSCASTASRASSPTSSGATRRPTRSSCARNWPSSATRSPARTATARACAARRATCEIGDARRSTRCPRMPLREARAFFATLDAHRAQGARSPRRSSRRSPRGSAFLINVGLDYLSLDRSRRHALGRRGAAHPPRLADRLRPDRRDVRARRAVDRPAPARQRPPARHAQAPARPRQHRDRRRARRGGDRGGRLRRRHGPGRRRARRRRSSRRARRARSRATKRR